MNIRLKFKYYELNISFGITVKKIKDSLIQEQYTTSESIMDNIERIVCRYYKINSFNLNNRTRKRGIVQARQICHFFSKKMTKKSLSDIGNRFGCVDHSTVMHSIKTINNLIECDRFIKQDIEYFSKILGINIDTINSNKTTGIV